MHPTDQATVERYQAELAEIEARRKVIRGVLRALRAKPQPPPKRQIVSLTTRVGTVGGGPIPSQKGEFTQAQPRTLLEAAEKALRSAGKPLAMPDLIKVIQSLGYRQDEDPKRLRGTLAPALKRRNDQKRTFANRGGEYALLEWESPEKS